MAIWASMQADISQLAAGDGERIVINTVAGVSYANVFWQSLSLSGDQGGQMFRCAASDLPADFTQGSTIEYDDITYAVTHRAPDGYGLEVVTLDIPR